MSFIGPELEKHLRRSPPEVRAEVEAQFAAEKCLRCGQAIKSDAYDSWCMCPVHLGPMRSKPYMETDRPEIEEPPESKDGWVRASQHEFLSNLFGQTVAENTQLRDKIFQLEIRMADLLLGQSEEERPASQKRCL